MLVSFRNGLLKYQSIGGNLLFPTFLSEQIVGSTFNVSINASTSLIGLISSGNKEYVVNVNSNVSNAWSGLTNGTMYYLFIELDRKGRITYTTSTIVPSYGTTDPVVGLQVGQTFFNTTSNLWKVWMGGFWETVNRLYVGRSDGSTTTHNTSGSFSAMTYDYQAGSLILDSNQKAIIKSDKTFLTTVDNLSINDVSALSTKFDLMLDVVEAMENIGAYTVCKRNSDGTISAATPGDVGNYLLSMALESAVIGSSIDALNSGTVTNLGWSWANIGTAVFVTETGSVVDYNPFTVAETANDAPPIGRVVSATSIVFNPPIAPMVSPSSVGPQGDPGVSGDDGWSPVLAVVTDVARRVLQVTDWVGGTGTKPATGSYVGPIGLVVAVGDAVDIRGATGAAGTGGGDELIANKTDTPELFVGDAVMYPSIAGMEAALRLFEQSLLNNMMGTVSGRNYARYFDDFVNFTQSTSQATTTPITIALQADVVGTNFLGAVKINPTGEMIPVTTYQHTPSKTASPVGGNSFNLYDGGVLEFICSVKLDGFPSTNGSRYFVGITTLNASDAPILAVEYTGTENMWTLRYGASTAVSTVSALAGLGTVVTIKVQVTTAGADATIKLFINQLGSSTDTPVAELTGVSNAALLLHEVYPCFGIDYQGAAEDSMKMVVDYIGLQGRAQSTRENFGFTEMLNGAVYPQ